MCLSVARRGGAGPFLARLVNLVRAGLGPRPDDGIYSHRIPLHLGILKGRCSLSGGTGGQSPPAFSPQFHLSI